MRLRRFGVSLLVAGATCTLSSGTGSAAPSLPKAPAAASVTCQLDQGSIVDVVLLIDQSESLKDYTSRETAEQLVTRIGPAIGRVADRLNDLLDGGRLADRLTLNVGIIAFGSRATRVRELLPLDVEDVKAKGVELSDARGLEGDTDYRKGLKAALDMFGADPESSCRIMLWFTDGKFDLPDSEFEVSEEIKILRDEVCGDGSGSSIAGQFRGLNVTSYAFLLQKDNSRIPDSKLKVMQASIEVMQALTGATGVTGTLPAGISTLAEGDTGECARFVTGDLAPARRGRVVVSAATLADQLFVLINESVGARTISPECPSELTVENGRSKGLPAPAFIERIDVTLLSDVTLPELSVYALNSAGERLQLAGSGFDATSKTLTISHDELEQLGLAGGWTLEVTSSQSERLDVCEQLTWRPLGRNLSVRIDGELQLGENDTAEFVVDWSSIGVPNPAGAIRSWTIEPIPADSGTFGDVGAFLGSESKVIFTPNRQTEDATIRQVRVELTPNAGDQQNEPAQQFVVDLEQELTVTKDSDAPSLQCGGLEVRLEGEAPESQKPLRVGPCRLELRSDKIPEATLSWKFDLPPVDGAPTWSVVGADGTPLTSGLEARTSTDVYLQASGPIPNADLSQVGDLTFTVAWSVGGNTATDDVVVPISISVMKRADLAAAIWIAVIVALVAALLSLAMLWFINAATAKLPSSDRFYFAEVPIQLGRSANGSAEWAPRDLSFDVSALRPPFSEHEGRDLSFGRVKLERKLPPLWRPFKAPWAELSGAGIVRATGGTRGTPRMSTAFGETAVVSFAEVPGVRAGQTFAGTVTLLLARQGAYTGVSERIQADVDRVLNDVLRESTEQAGVAPDLGGSRSGDVHSGTVSGPRSDAPNPSAGRREPPPPPSRSEPPPPATRREPPPPPTRREPPPPPHR